MSLKAYQKAQVAAENPRAIEYRLFGQITGALMDAKSAGAKGMPLIDVIDRNRRLWSMLAGDCMSDGNQLPKELRAQIVSLAIWLATWLANGLANGPATWLANGPANGLATGLATGLANGLATGLAPFSSTRISAGSSTSPRSRSPRRADGWAAGRSPHGSNTRRSR